MLFKSSQVQASVINLSLASVNALRTAITANGVAEPPKLGVMSDFKAVLDPLVSDIFALSISNIAWSERSITRDGLTIQMDHPFTPTTMIALVTYSQSTTLQLPYWKRDGSKAYASVKSITAGAAYTTPLTSYLTALLLLKSIDHALAIPDLSVQKRASMNSFKAQVLAQLEDIGNTTLEMCLLPEETAVASAGYLWLQRPAEPVGLAGLVTPVAYALTPALIQAYFEAGIARANTYHLYNAAVALLGSTPGYTDPFESFFVSQGAAGWADRDMPWARLSNTFEMTYVPLNLTTDWFDAKAPALWTLGGLYLRWFRADRTLGEADLLTASGEYAKVITKLVPSFKVDTAQLVESLEEYIVGAFPAVDWTPTTLAAVMAAVDFRRHRVAYVYPTAVPNTLSKADGLFLRTLTNFLKAPYTTWPDSLKDRVTPGAEGAIVVNLPSELDIGIAVESRGSIYSRSLAVFYATPTLHSLAEDVTNHLFEMEEVIWSLLGTTTRDVVIDNSGSVQVKGARSRLLDLLGANFQPESFELVIPYV